jgi:hypothetical protein
MRGVRLLAVAVALVVFAGCGGDDPALSDRAAQRLRSQVAAVVYAIAGRSYANARTGLAEVRATTIRLTDAGEVDGDRATEIVDRIEALDTLLVRQEASG